MFRRRWLTPREWVHTRKAMHRAQLAEPGTCAACGRYLLNGPGIHHWHYTLRWLSGFYVSNRPSLEPIDIVLTMPPGPASRFVRMECAGFTLNVAKLTYRTDGLVSLRLRRRDLPW
jgi:hypothetical protein